MTSQAQLLRQVEIHLALSCPKQALSHSEMGWTSVHPKIVFFSAGQNYGKLKVSTRNTAISARVTESSGQ